MKIYIDYVLLLNFMIDFLLLLATSILLKRNSNINRIIISSFFGSLTILLLFININSIELFFIKLFVCIIMILISFGYKNIRYFFKNMITFYLISIVLGGVLYAINIQTSYNNIGIVFIKKNFSTNFIFLLSPIIIYLYIKQIKSFKTNYSNYYKIKIFINNIEYNLTGFVDTGNKLKDPYNNRPIIITNNKFDIKKYNKILIPYNTIDSSGLLECIKIDKVIIENVGVKKNILLGFMDKNINIDGVDCILQDRLLEE